MQGVKVHGRIHSNGEIQTAINNKLQAQLSAINTPATNSTNITNQPVGSQQPRESSSIETGQTSNTENRQAENFVKLLARCKENIRILKRIPRGARILAANKLTQCIDDCLANPKSDKKWEKLLTFAYTALQGPVKTKNVSLTTSVKRNVDSAVLNIPKASNKQPTISISRRVEYKIADVKGAVKILSSMDTLAPQNKDTQDRPQTSTIFE